MDLKKLLPLALLVSGSVHASSCIMTPLQTRLEEADIIFVATVTEAALVDSIEELSQYDLDRAARGQRPRGLPASVRLFYVVRETIKGEPEKLGTLSTRVWYDDPMDDRFAIGPGDPISPGQSLLVIGNEGEPSYLGYCHGSRRWDREVRKAVSHYLEARAVADPAK